MDTATIVTSAVVASAISGLMLLFNGYLERRSRRKETLFNLAFDLAKEKTNLVATLASKSGNPITLRDNIFLAEGYYKWLKHLDQKGELPKDAHKAEARSRNV